MQHAPRSGACRLCSLWSKESVMDKDVPLILELVCVMLRIVLEVIR